MSIRHADEARTPILIPCPPTAADGLLMETNRRATRKFERRKDAVKTEDLVLFIGD
jgi:hypothetical protein